MKTLLEAAHPLVVSLENLGFGKPDADINGGDCVDVINRFLPNLQQAVFAENEATVRPANGKRRVISLSESAYDTIIETLDMDSKSKAFDPELRAEIKRALKSIREESPKVRIDVHRGVADVTKAPAYVEVRIVDHDNH